jgi:hypothetical protein
MDKYIKKLMTELSSKDPNISKMADRISGDEEDRSATGKADSSTSKKNTSDVDKQRDPESEEGGYYTVNEFVGIQELDKQFSEEVYSSMEQAEEAAEEAYKQRTDPESFTSGDDYYVLVTTTNENGDITEDSLDVYLISQDSTTADSADIYKFLAKYYESSEGGVDGDGDTEKSPIDSDSKEGDSGSKEIKGTTEDSDEWGNL